MKGKTVAVVLSLVLPLVFVACSPQSKVSPYEAQVSNLNGTWFAAQPGGPTREDLLKSSNVFDISFGWGIGKEVPNATLEIDLERKEIHIPPGGTGAGVILEAKKVGLSDIEVQVLMSGDAYIIKQEKLSSSAAQKAIERSIEEFVVHFTDHDHITVDHPNEDRGRPFGLVSGDKPLKWFRLSGPPESEKKP